MERSAEMKVIIAGSRDYSPTCSERIDEIVNDTGLIITEVVSGMCKGADLWGELWAETKGIPVMEFPADWKTNGKAAGPIRNQQMADYADAMIAIKTSPTSIGTDDMIRRARKRGIPVFVYTTYNNPKTK